MRDACGADTVPNCHNSQWSILLNPLHARHRFPFVAVRSGGGAVVAAELGDDVEDEPDAVVDAKAAEQSGDMGAHGGDGDAELLGDLLVGPAVHDVFEDVGLSRRQSQVGADLVPLPLGDDLCW